MLNLILGAAYSGKSEYIMRKLGELAARGKDKLILVVPDQASFTAEKELLERFGAVIANRISVMRFNRLASEVFDRYLYNAGEVIGDTGKLMLMNRALQSVKDKLQVFSRQAGRHGFALEMISLYDELKFDTVTFSQLRDGEKLLRGELIKNKIKDIVLICEEYEKLLTDRFSNASDSLEKACDILEKERFFEGYTVFFDSFARFDNLKMKVITHAVSQADEVYITLPTDSAEILPNETGRFLNVKKTAHRLKNSAKQAGCEVAEDIILQSKPAKPDISFLEKSFYADTTQSAQIVPENIHIFKASTIVQECDGVARTVRKLLRTKGYRLRDICIIMRDDKYFEPIRRSLAKFSLPVFGDIRKGIASEPLVLFLKYAFSCVLNGFRTEDIMGLLKTELAYSVDLSFIEEIENYAFVWQINGVRKWCSEFTLNPKGFKSDFTDSERETLEKLEAFRKSFIPTLEKFKNAVKGGTVKDYCTSIFTLMRDFEVDKGIISLAQQFKDCGEPDSAMRQHSVYEIVTDALEQAVMTLGECRMSFSEFSELFLPSLMSSTVGEIPPQIDEITVGNASRMRTLSPKATFIVGVNEGEFPLYGASGGILTQNDKVRLSQAGFDLGTDSEKMIIEEKFFAYCAVTSASEELYISYRLNNMTGEECNESEIISAIRLIFPNIEINSFDIIEAEDLEGEEQAFEYLAVNWNSNTPLVGTLKKYFSESDIYSGRFKALQNSTGNAAACINDKNLAKELFGEKINLSATKFEKFSQCPFSFFCNYGLGVRKLEQAKIDVRISGLMVHYVMENFFLLHKGEDLTAVTFEKVKSQIEMLVSSYIREEMGVSGEQLTARDLLYIGKAQKVIYNTVIQTLAELAQSKFSPADFEYKIGSKSHPSYELCCDEGSVSIEGSIDRVDVMNLEGEDYVRVIDYKTGNKEFNLYNLYHGLNAQMLIYLMALGQSGTKYEQAVASGVLYMHASNPGSSKVDRHSDQEDIDTLTREKFTMRGMVLDDARVIEGMESDIVKSGKFIPVKKGKNGYTGNVISSSDLSFVFSRVNSLLVDMGNSLHEGKISDIPSVIGGKSPCEYCDYISVCGHIDGIGERQFDSLRSFSQALTVFREGE